MISITEHKVLGSLHPITYTNKEGHKHVILKHDKSCSIPRVTILGEDGSEIVAQVSYPTEDSIEISVNESVCYTVYIY